MLAPERRTRADIIIAVAIVVLVAAATAVIWGRADANGAESVTASRPAEPPPTSDRLPTRLQELWHTQDTATDRALTAAGAVVSTEDDAVIGHDPQTGEQLWRYQRDLPLCGVEAQFGMVIAVYRDERGCSQTTMLSGADGKRRNARSTYMDSSVELSTDGTYLLAHGPNRLEMWRSDLVRTIEYGYVDAKVNVQTQPRQGCSLLSAGSSSARLAVVERCPDDPANRLTMLDPAPDEDTVPEEYGSHVLTGPAADAPGSRVLAVNDNRIVLYQPGRDGPDPRAPRLTVFDSSGNPLVVHELSAPMAETDDFLETRKIGSAFLVFTGNSVIALNASTLDPMWTAPKALGTPALLAGRLLLPVADAIAVLDPATGTEMARIPVQRPGYDQSPISLEVIGDTVLEKRGGELFALG